MNPTVKLSDPDIAEIILGQSPPSSAYNKIGDGLPFFQGKADFGLLHPTARMWCSEGEKFATAGDVLLSVRAPVGDVNIATTKCVIGRGLAAIRARSKIDPWFLYFALLHARPVLESRATGSTFESVNRTTLGELEIPFCETFDQKAIASILKTIVTKIADEEAIEGITVDTKRAAMRELFTRGLRGEPQRETEIGLVPESWDVVALGSFGKIGNGSTPKKTVPAYWQGGTYPWLTSAKVYDRDIEFADQYVTDVALKECHLPKVRPGAVLMAITGQGKTLGHCAVLKFEASISQHVAYLQADTEKTDPGFIRGYLETQYDYLRQVSSGGGSTKGALTCAFLRDLPIPLPGLDEQREIVTILDAIDRKIALHQGKHAVLEELFKSLLHKLMTGEVRVNELDLSALDKQSAAEGIPA
jgi:type I restriction enzyme S subunit